MRSLLAALPLLLLPLAASAQPADLSDSIRGLIDRFRGRQRPPAVEAAGNVGRVVSWNVQTLGKKAPAKKKAALKLGLARALAGAGPAILAAQEVANDAGAAALARALPGQGEGWTTSFEDTRAAMNNALYFSPGVAVDCAGNIALEGVRHPVHMAHVVVGSADFTILSVHLTYAKGDASASAVELEIILDWVRAQAAKPGSDPDFVIAGDFNLPTGRGKLASARAGDRSWTALDGLLGGGFTALVDEPTSRRGRTEAANNYDHFVVSDDFRDEELVVAGAVSAAEVEDAEREAGTRASDHYPIAMTFRKSGNDSSGKPLVLDGASVCR